MPRPVKPRRWESSEILEVVNYLYDNFDKWYDSPYIACAEAIRATNVKRGSSSVYGKIYNMIKVMDDYLRTGKKSSNTCDILWQNKKVRDLIKEMCYKTKERTTKDLKKSSEEASTSQIDVPQMPFSIETVDEIYDEQIKKVENLVLKSRETIETSNQEIRDLYEQISQRRSELNGLIEIANDKLDKLKKFSIV